jgi:uncharacterized protein YjbJ (UPF0337 family)
MTARVRTTPTRSVPKESLMGDKMDQAKGRAKEAAGDLTDDDSLKREGKADRVGGEIKEKVGDVVDKVKDKVDDVVHRDK